MDLIRELHKQGYHLYRHVRGRSNNVVNPHRDRKSVGKETTFEFNILDERILEQNLMIFAKKVEERLTKLQKHGKTIVLKLRYSDFTTVTKRLTLNEYIHDAKQIYQAAALLLRETYTGKESIRLIGLTVTNLKPVHFENLRLEGL